jgi:hypothetical protein
MRLPGAISSSVEVWRTDLQLWAISHGASTWLIDLEPYEACTVACIPLHCPIDPIEGFIDAILFDGTAEVVARWPSMRRPSPLQATSQERGLVLEGIPSVGPEGDIIMIDPDFRRTEFPAVA